MKSVVVSTLLLGLVAWLLTPFVGIAAYVGCVSDRARSGRQAHEVIRQHGLRCVHAFDLGRKHFQLLYVGEDAQVAGIVERLRESGAFESVEHQMPIFAGAPDTQPAPAPQGGVWQNPRRDPSRADKQASTLPSDLSFPEQWGLNNGGIPHTSFPADVDVDAPEAWAITQGKRSVVVAVIDTGVDYSHPDLVANIWVNEAEQNGISFWDDDFNGVVDDVHGCYVTPLASEPDWIPDLILGDPLPMDIWGHGTHVAGLIAAQANNTTGFEQLPDGGGRGNIVGVAPGVRVMPINVGSAPIDPDHGPTMWPWSIAVGIGYAVDNGAAVINMSLGQDGLAGLISGGAGMVFVAIAEAELGGVPVVVSTGNNHPGEINFLADYRTTLSVGAIDRMNRRAYYSNYGSALDVVAPGDAFSTVPTYAVGITTELNYHALSGTSMATPVVAGIVAMVRSVAPSLNPESIREIICTTCDYIDDPDGDGTVSDEERSSSDNAYGRPWNKFTGFGRVNAAAAVAKAAELGRLWSDATWIGKGWIHSDWFGDLNTMLEPWVYHSTHGWLLESGADPSQVWFYDVLSGCWQWTGRGTYPFFYRYGKDPGWMYYQVGSSLPRWFFDYNAGRWIPYL